MKQATSTDPRVKRRGMPWCPPPQRAGFHQHLTLFDSARLLGMGGGNSERDLHVGSRKVRAVDIPGLLPHLGFGRSDGAVKNLILKKKRKSNWMIDFIWIDTD